MENKRRKYQDIIEMPLWNGKFNKNISTFTTTKLRPGLKQIHIGKDVWLIGKVSQKKDKPAHQVIYGPNNKEFHLYGSDVKWINDTFEINEYGGRESYCNRQGNFAIECKVKIYILTNILDKKENWCFNLNEKPEIGKRIKVIYDNGTVKWVDFFTGEFEPAELISKRWTAPRDAQYFTPGYINQKFVNPVAYRIK